MLKIKQFIFNMFGVNTYLATDDDTNEAAVIDPGMESRAERDLLDDYVKTHGIKVTKIINTHLHLDHCFGNNHMKERYGVETNAHTADAALGLGLAAQCRRFGIRYEGQGVEIDRRLDAGDVIKVGKSSLAVIHVPGHTPGGIALYCSGSRLLFSGDSLFRESIGRTDLDGGDQFQLIDSIRSRLYSLPDSTAILPGHGTFSSIGHEKRHNPFV